ncbi:MAG: TonB family protein [Pseudomonadota bacterium]
MSDSKEEDEAKQELFGNPVKLFHPVLYMSQDSFNRRANGEYFVDIEFEVQPNGQVRDVKVVESNAPADARRLVRQMARRARYRPRYENGEAMSTTGVGSRQRVVIVEPEQACDPSFPGCRQGR